MAKRTQDCGSVGGDGREQECPGKREGRAEAPHLCPAPLCPALAAPRAPRSPGRLSLPPGPAPCLRGGANSGGRAGRAQPCAPRDSAPLGLHLQAAAARALPAACSESAAVCAVRLQLWLLAWSRALSAGAGLRWTGLGWASCGLSLATVSLG